MSIADVASMNIGGIAAISVVGLMSLIQVSKIEINPWTWLARKFGNAINHDISEKIDDVNKRIDDVEKSIKDVKEQQEADRAEADKNIAVASRVRILRFNEELLRKQKHSKESFDQALSDITDYRHYCDTHPNFENERAVMAIQNIERCYQTCMNESDFL